MLSSPSALSLSSASSATASSIVRSEPTKPLTWQTAVYLVVALGTVYTLSACTRYHAPSPPSHPHPIPLLSYFSFTTAFVAFVAGIIWLIWNDPCTSSTPRRGKMEPVKADSALHFPSASTLVQRMCRYFLTTLWPALRNLRQVTATSLGDASVAMRRTQPALPLYVPHEFREPRLAAPRPAMPRDISSFRVQSNPYSSSDSSSWPPASPYPLPIIPGFPGSAP